MTTIKEPLISNIIEGIKNLKGNEIVTLDLRKIDQTITDYFVICEGDSMVHVNSISESIKREVKSNIGEDPLHVDGKLNRQWIILDYSNVVVHVFLKEWRSFYKLEELWGDAVFNKIED